MIVSHIIKRSVNLDQREQFYQSYCLELFSHLFILGCHDNIFVKDEFMSYDKSQFFRGPHQNYFLKSLHFNLINCLHQRSMSFHTCVVTFPIFKEFLVSELKNCPYSISILGLILWNFKHLISTNLKLSNICKYRIAVNLRQMIEENFSRKGFP